MRGSLGQDLQADGAERDLVDGGRDLDHAIDDRKLLKFANRSHRFALAAAEQAERDARTTVGLTTTLAAGLPPQSRSKLPSQWNFKYSVKGSRVAAPVQVLDDGEFTYVRFARYDSAPAVFEVDAEKKETLANFRREGDWLVLEKVTRQLVFRMAGNAEIACVFNDAFPQRPDSALCFVDVSAAHSTVPPQERAALLARFHVQRADGSRLDGAAAFVAMWARLPGWRWLARVGRVPRLLRRRGERAHRCGAHRGERRPRTTPVSGREPPWRKLLREPPIHIHNGGSRSSLE